MFDDFENTDDSLLETHEKPVIQDPVIIPTPEPTPVPTPETNDGSSSFDMFGGGGGSSSFDMFGGGGTSSFDMFGGSTTTTTPTTTTTTTTTTTSGGRTSGGRGGRNPVDNRGGEIEKADGTGMDWSGMLSANTDGGRRRRNLTWEWDDEDDIRTRRERRRLTRPNRRNRRQLSSDKSGSDKSALKKYCKATYSDKKERKMCEKGTLPPEGPIYPYAIELPGNVCTPLKLENQLDVGCMIDGKCSRDEVFIN